MKLRENDKGSKNHSSDKLTLALVPCFNEGATIGSVVLKAKNYVDKVLVIDDLLATGGTVKANIELVEKLGGEIVGVGFLVELGYLDGRKAIGDKYDVFSIIHCNTTNG